MNSEVHDSELVKAVQAGDYEAFGTLVARYQGLIYRLCYRMTGNASDAEDLAHEAFVEAYLKLHQLRQPEKFVPWLKTLTCNLCRMWYRQNKSEPVDPMTDERLHAQPAPIESDESVYARMFCGLSKLSAPHRLALILHYWEGLSYDEVARFLEIPIGTLMSRLHRARHALKRLMEQLTEEEEIPMISDVTFRQEVDAEIAVLLEMFHKNPGAVDRLSVILHRSPERFAQLVQNADDEAMLDNLALLLHRLGHPAVEVVLECFFSSDASLRARALMLLKRWSARGKPGPSHEAHLLLDKVIASPVEAQIKTELLVELMEACQSERMANLFTDVVLCYPDVALPVLLERFWSASSPAALYQPAQVLYALCRTGTRFCEALLVPLRSGDVRQQTLALAGLEALGRSEGCLEHSDKEQPAAQLALLKRSCGNYAPVAEEHLDARIFQATAEAVAGLLTHQHADIRETACRILGLFKARSHLEALKTCMRHSEPSTRLVAIRAIGAIGDEGCTEPLMKIAQEGQPIERCAAIEALGRLQSTEAQALLTQWLDDTNAQVRQAAVIALGELNRETAHTTLQRLTRSPDKALAKAAAKALYAGVKRRQPSETTQKRLHKIRGEGRPLFYTSIEAVLRALPAIQPYEESELTRRIAQVCSDYSTTRRYLVMDGRKSIMNRAHGVYELTELGKAVWRVEHFIQTHYLVPVSA